MSQNEPVAGRSACEGRAPVWLPSSGSGFSAPVSVGPAAGGTGPPPQGAAGSADRPDGRTERPSADTPRHLVLIRHSLSEMRPGMPPSQWHLGHEGRLRCHPLAHELEPFDLRVIATSDEPKALETANLVGLTLRLPVEVHPDLREHERAREPIVSRAEFESQIARLFSQPESLVYGDETAAEAQLRFARAITRLIEAHPDGDIAVVSHGTVIALFGSACAGSDPFPFWRRLGMPAYVVIELPQLIVRHVEWEIAGAGSRP